MADEVYVTYTCKNSKCRNAFLDLDPDNSINDVPLKTRYCPECVKKGFKNEPFKKINKIDLAFKEEVLSRNITDAKDIAFLRKTYNKSVKFKQDNNFRVLPKSIFKEALEILSYQPWKQ